MKKKFYETPEAELFTVRFEGNLCQSPYGYSTNGLQRGLKYTQSGWDEWEEETGN